MNSYPLLKKSLEKKLTVVLDIDETLISVTRWADELKLNDKIVFDNKKCSVSAIFQEVQFENLTKKRTEYHRYWIDNSSPLGPFESPVCLRDDIRYKNDILKVISKCTLKVGLKQHDTLLMVQINDKSILKFQKNVEKDMLIFDNKFIVRLRPHLAEFLRDLSLNTEVILWTAAVRSLYTQLMAEVHRYLLQKLNLKNIRLWNHILFRDNCLVKNNGCYLKDISFLGRDLNSTLIVDNLYQNFEGYEYNGLPIKEFYGDSCDSELYTLNKLLKNIHSFYEQSQKQGINFEISEFLHGMAYHYNFSGSIIETMMSEKLLSAKSEAEMALDLDLDLDLELDLDKIKVDLKELDLNYVKDSVSNSNSSSNISVSSMSSDGF